MHERSQLMADQPTKIHPVEDIAAPRLSRPLAPEGSFESDKGDQAMQHQHPIRQSTPIINSTTQHQLSIQPSMPLMHSKPLKGKSCWCKCLCWTISLIVLLLIIFGATAAIIYITFQPKIPKYSVDNLRISDLRLNFDLSLYAKFDVRITAYNPNKKIGIYYENGSQLDVWYKSTKLCQGTLPKFYQGHQNRTVLNVALTGQNQYGSTLLAALQEEQQTGRIPLDLKFDVPVRIELGQLKLKKVWILGNCMLIVDSLSTNSLISIKASTCKFKVKL